MHHTDTMNRPDCVLQYVNIDLNIVHLRLINGVVVFRSEVSHKYATSQVMNLASLSVEQLSLNSCTEA